MLSDQFRASPERVGRVRELLNDPTLAAAIVCLQDEGKFMINDLEPSADSVASVRRLSFICGYTNAIDTLLSLAAPLPVPEKDEEPFQYLVDKK
jgi:hypothetical protein